MTTATKTIQFEKLIPDFKRFTPTKALLKSRSDNYKVLQYLNFDGEYLTVTDSHRMLRVNSEYVEGLPSQDPFLYDLTERKIVESNTNFPETNRLVPSNYNTTIELDNIKEIRQSVDELHKLGSVNKGKNHVIKFNVDTNSLALSDREGKEKFDHNLSIQGEDTEIHANSKYVKDALMTVNKLAKLSYDNPTMNIVSRLRPINIEQNDIYNVIVLPVRIY